MVTISYTHHDGGKTLKPFEITTNSHRAACELIDNYPWAEELALFDELGEIGYLYFYIGDINAEHASYQFTPIDEKKGDLTFSVVTKPGFLSMIGREVVDIDFELVSINEAKSKIQDLFNYSIESLYNKYN